MMNLISVIIGQKKFELIGIADIAKKKTHFQAIVNGVPFAQDEEYTVVSQKFTDAVVLNQPEKHEGVQ